MKFTMIPFHVRVFSVFLTFLAEPLHPSSLAAEADLAPTEAELLHSLRTKGEASADHGHIRAHFVKQLLQGRYASVPRDEKGIIIKDATIDGVFDLNYVRVKPNVLLTGCIFSGPVTMIAARFDGEFSLAGCKLGSADLRKLKVEGDFSLEGVYCSGQLNADGATVGGELIAHELHMATTNSEASFVRLITKESAFYTGAVFEGKVNFSYAVVGRELVADDVKCMSRTDTPLFNDIKVTEGAFFTNAQFAAGIDLTRASIGGDLNMDGIEGHSSTNTLSLSMITVGGILSLNAATLSGKVDLDGARLKDNLSAVELQSGMGTMEFSMIGSTVEGDVDLRQGKVAGMLDVSESRISNDFNLSGMSFLGENKEANFNRLHVGGSFVMTNTVFLGNADFTKAVIGMEFLGSGCIFSNRTSRISFNGMSVGNSLSVAEAIFLGEADFTQVKIRGQLRARNTRFLHTKEAASFNGMEVGNLVTFEGAKFSGDADFILAGCGSQFIASGSYFGGAARFQRIRVNDSIYLDEHAQFAGIVDFTGGATGKDLRVSAEFLDADSVVCFCRMDVPGIAIFSNCTFQSELRLSDSQFSSIAFLSVKWANSSKHVLNMSRMGYERMAVDENVDHAEIGHRSAEEALLLLKRADYSADIYASLESMYRRQGYAKLADQTFVAGKRRERYDVAGGYGPGRFLWSCFLDLFVVFGRSPIRAFIWSALVVSIGAWIFKVEIMEPAKDLSPREFDSWKAVYNRCWYSFDLFVPVIDLGMADACTPKPMYSKSLFWMRVQIILGWALVPIAIAAWTGILPN